MQANDPIAALRERFPEAVQDVVEFRGETTLTIDAPQIAEVCQFLRDEQGLLFNFLVDVTGVDDYPLYPRFNVLYHLYSMLYNQKLRLKVRLGAEDDEEGALVVPTVTHLWPGANWQEREVFDMFGIRFEGHPDMRRILMPEEWDGYPQRKDYPLGYETVQFSFNYDEINEHKPYAKE